MKLVKYNNYSFSIVDTDGLVFWHQGISGYDVAYARLRCHLFMGLYRQLTSFTDDSYFSLAFYNNRKYRIQLCKLALQSFTEKNAI